MPPLPKRPRPRVSSRDPPFPWPQGSALCAVSSAPGLRLVLAPPSPAWPRSSVHRRRGGCSRLSVRGSHRTRSSSGRGGPGASSCLWACSCSLTAHANPIRTRTVPVHHHAATWGCLHTHPVNRPGLELWSRHQRRCGPALRCLLQPWVALGLRAPLLWPCWPVLSLLHPSSPQVELAWRDSLAQGPAAGPSSSRDSHCEEGNGASLAGPVPLSPPSCAASPGCTWEEGQSQHLSGRGMDSPHLLSRGTWPAPQAPWPSGALAGRWAISYSVPATWTENCCRPTDFRRVLMAACRLCSARCRTQSASQVSAGVGRPSPAAPRGLPLRQALRWAGRLLGASGQTGPRQCWVCPFHRRADRGSERLSPAQGHAADRWKPGLCHCNTSPPWARLTAGGCSLPLKRPRGCRRSQENGRHAGLKSPAPCGTVPGRLAAPTPHSSSHCERCPAAPPRSL